MDNDKTAQTLDDATPKTDTEDNSELAIQELDQASGGHAGGVIGGPPRPVH